MDILGFLFGSGWSIPWHFLFYAGALPAVIFLHFLRNTPAGSPGMEAVLLSYAVGSTTLLAFSAVHTLVAAVTWQTLPLLKYGAAFLAFFLLCIVAWTFIPALLERRTRFTVVGIHALVAFLVVFNLWALWFVQQRPQYVEASSPPDDFLAIPPSAASPM